MDAPRVVEPSSAAPLSGLSRRAAIGLGVGALAVRTAGHAAAQSATPSATGCAGATKLGTMIPFVGSDGTELGQLSVDALTDPFTGYSPNSAPPRGSRFVLLAVTVRNTGAQPWQFDPGALALQDSDGFLLRPTSVDLGAKPNVPGLAAQTVAPGATAKGVVGYASVKGTTLKRCLFIPAADRLLVLADLG